MSAMLLVAAHFAIQARTQDMAQATVEQWLQHSGGSVENVQFHLLRNALTLQRVSIKSGDMSLFVPEMLVYGRVDSLLSKHPALSRVTMTDPQMKMPASSALHLLTSQPSTGNSMFHQIWLMAHHLEIRGGILELTAGAKHKRSWSISNVNLLIREGSEGRTVQGGGRYRGASLTVNSQMRRASRSENGKIYLSWDRLDGHSAAKEIFGLSPMNGEISGQMRWKWMRADGSGFTRSHLKGDMHVTIGTRVVGKSADSPSLSWHADHTTNGWHVAISANDWPLAPIKRLSPIWYGRHLSHGYFTGDIETEWANSDPEPSLIRVGKGEIQDLDYVPDNWSKDATSQPDWHVDRIEFGNAKLKVNAHALDFGSLVLKGGQIRLLPGQSLRSTNSIPWHLESKVVTLDQMTIVFEFPGGKQVLRSLPLSGKASLVDGSFQCDVSAADAPVRWKIEGEGQLAWPGSPNLHLDVTADGLPLTHLRALLPFDENSNAEAAVQLDGYADFTLAVVVDGDKWTASGIARGQNVMVSWQGDSWRAAKITMGLDKIGSGLPVQSINKLRVENWQYQGALQSLTSTAIAGRSPDSLFPWRSGVLWNVGKLELQGGVISFGRADAVWGRKINLLVSGWSGGKMATFRLNGDVDGGAMQAAGYIGQIGGVLHTDIKGSVLNALPFFLNEWLQVSDAPRVVRGRLSSHFVLMTDEQGTDHMHLRLKLSRWLLESGAFPNDPFLERTGFGAHDLLNRLGAGGHMSILDVNGVWKRKQPFAWSDVGDALLSALKNKASTSDQEVSPYKSTVLLESRIRLHGLAEFSQNERLRLHKLWRRMKANPGLVVDLVPQVQDQHLDVDMVEAIRHTESMISRFMTARRIAVSRIFPVWPTESDRARGGLGIRVEVLKP